MSVILLSFCCYYDNKISQVRGVEETGLLKIKRWLSANSFTDGTLDKRHLQKDHIGTP